MKITFWGTRGSIPAPGRDTVKYGGNTPCISVEVDSKPLIILDAGTGIRKLGLKLLKEGNTPINAYLFITHSHWDHIQGIPFFQPIYGKDNEFTIVSNTNTTNLLKQSIKDLLKHPYFPVTYEALPSKISFFKPLSGEFRIGSTKINILPTNHPDSTSAYKFTEKGRSFVYMTDNEITFPEYNIGFFDTLVKFCHGTDLLVHDAMYTKDEYSKKIGWGHTCFEAAVELALKAKVKRLAFFHHNPEYTDKLIDSAIKSCSRIIKQNKSKLKCFGAQEGKTINL